jgi:hypothetical protein
MLPPTENKNHYSIMEYGICPLSIIPIRISPSHRSELISQMLFGEMAEVLEAKGKHWLRIICETDGFIGWVEREQLLPISENNFLKYKNNFAYCLEILQPAIGIDSYIAVTMGAKLPEYDGLRFSLNKLKYSFSGQALSNDNLKATPEMIVKLARKYLNTPYLWGGRSPLGIDSSGLVQMVYQMAGISIPRDPQEQVKCGTSVEFIALAQPGDIAFFENKYGKIVHSGILLSDNQLLHALGKVKIDILDHYGVFDINKNIYLKSLRIIKRLLPTINGNEANITTKENAISITKQLSLNMTYD